MYYAMLFCLGALALRAVIRIFFTNTEGNTVEFKNKWDAFISLLTLAVTLMLLGATILNFADSDIFNKIRLYTWMPLLLGIHFMLTLFLMTVLVVLSGFFVSLFDYFKNMILVRDIVYLAKKIYKLIRNISWLNKIIILMNDYLNPIYGFKIDFKNMYSIKTIKKVMVIFYIASGLVIASPFRNIIDLTYKDMMTLEEYMVFQKDIDLYQWIFIITLFPIALSYIAKKKEKETKREPVNKSL